MGACTSASRFWINCQCGGIVRYYIFPDTLPSGAHHLMGSCFRSIEYPYFSTWSNSLRPGSEAELFMSRTKFMKSSASESISNACFNLERLSRSFCLARPGISPLERLWKGFDSDAELFMYGTQCVNYYNVFCKQFDQNAHFSPFELSSTAIETGV